MRPVFVAIAPARGGGVCLASVCGGALIGIEAFGAPRAEDYRERLLEHLRRIRRKEAYARSFFVLCAARGAGFAVGDIEQFVLRSIGKVVRMRDLDVPTEVPAAAHVRMLHPFVCTDASPERVQTELSAQLRVVGGGGLADALRLACHARQTFLAGARRGRFFNN